MVEMRSRYASGAAPVLIRLNPNGMIEAGADPYYFRVVAGVVGPLFDEPGGFDRDALGRAPASRWPRRASTSAAVPGNTKAGSGQIYSPRAVSFARPVFAQASSKPNACANTPRPFPRCAAISPSTSSPPKSSGAGCSRRRPAGFRFAFKVPEQITCKVFPAHARYGPQAGKENEAFLDRQHAARDVPAAAAAVPRARRRC